MDLFEYAKRQLMQDRGEDGARYSMGSSLVIGSLGVLGIIGFVLSAVVLSMVITDQKRVNEINHFSANILDNYLTNKCVNCIPMDSLVYSLNASLNNGNTGYTRMYLTGDALAEDQFITGFETPCDECVNSIGYDWSVSTTAAVVDGFGIQGGTGAVVEGDPYDLSQYGLTFDPLGIWMDKSGITVSDKGFNNRCRGSIANSLYIVVISSDLVQDVCCEYVICMCSQPGPQEWCTRPLLDASNPAYAAQMNCQSGALPGGCGCGQDVC